MESASAAQQPARHFGLRRASIGVGNLVIVYVDHATLVPIRVTPGTLFECKYGKFEHDKMIGKKFGSKISALLGFIYLLPPTPELWAEALTHRTQILFLADVSMIILQLNLLPGNRVVEAGTGSGALSHAIARSIGDSGHLFTYEFNAERAKMAAEEFRANGLEYCITCQCADVCDPNWCYPGLDNGTIDAVIFDVPQPWDAIPRIGQIIRPGGRLCTFSPCIEQISSTMQVLAENGFTRAEVVEVLYRNYAVMPQLQQPNTIMSAVLKARTMLEASGDEEGSERSGSQAVERLDSSSGEYEAASKRQRIDNESTSCTGLMDPKNMPLPGLLTKQFSDKRGHTGFLLFCSKTVG